MMAPEQASATAILLCIGGAVLTLLVSRWKTVAGWLAFLFTTSSAAFVFSGAFTVLTSHASAHQAMSGNLPRLGLPLRFYVDGLSALFLLLAACIAVPACLYSISYMRHYTEYGVARFYPCFLLFIAGMYGLLSTSDMMWFFFVFWQLMTLPSFALIRFEYKKPENVFAANKYLIVMQVACAAAMGGAALLARGVQPAAGPRYDFDVISANVPTVLTASPVLATLAFALFLIGFGIKAGMWPFGQIWLPDAHPAAPSPVSAMLSGVMIKTGVYGLLRSFFWLIPSDAAKAFPIRDWGIVIAVLGTITLFTGTMQALREQQMKRLLAYSSIGQVGYILFATGACLCLLAAGTPMASGLASLALFGALLHVVNHGVFKSLLFLNAGSVLQATGTQDLNKLGGLMRYMPLTGLTALIASFSIAGVPLTNGFVSKWAIFAAAFQGAPFAAFLPMCALVGILTSVVTLALFIKFFGAAFLSRGSALVHLRAHTGARLEVDWISQLPQLLLAVLCVVMGILPAIGAVLLQHVFEAGRQGYAAVLAENFAVTSTFSTGLTEVTASALFVPLALAAVLATGFLFAFLLARLGHSQRRAASPWLCGYTQEAECHRYVAANFYREIQRYVAWGKSSSRTASGGVRQPQ